MKLVEDLTFGELKERGKALKIRVIGLKMDAMRSAITEAEARQTPPPAEKTKVAPETETQIAPPIEAPAIVPAEDEPTKADDALADLLVSETVAKLELEKVDIKGRIELLKKQSKAIDDAEKQIKKAEKEALRGIEKAKAKAEKEKARQDKAAKLIADREKARADKEKELAVTYEVGKRVQVTHKGDLVTADVIASDIYDSRSGFSFYRFRRVLLDPADKREVPGGYFFKRNYTIPQRVATDNDLPAPKIIAD